MAMTKGYLKQHASRAETVAYKGARLVKMLEKNLGKDHELTVRAEKATTEFYLSKTVFENWSKSKPSKKQLSENQADPF